MIWDNASFIYINFEDLADLLNISPDKIKKGETILDILNNKRF